MNRKSLAVCSSRGLGTPRKNERQSLSALGLDKSDTNAHLYEAIINDPQKRAMVLQLLSQEKHLINDILRKEGKTPMKQTKKVAYCESPTALFRRKALEKKQGFQETNSNTSSSSESGGVVPSPVPFEKLLDGVVAFVEVKTKSGDRSSATKAVVASMGAEVREQLTKDVTHVIFKDGSYSTYQKAKLIKAHLVSILWIEAIRKNHARVPEKDFPVLGAEAFNANLSVLCQQMQEEYEEALQDEVNKTLDSSKISAISRSNRRLTALPTELYSVFRKKSLAELKKTVKETPRRQTTQNLPEENQSFLSSDNSDLGMIDGEITKKIIQDLELSTPENTINDISVMKSIENIDDSKFKSLHTTADSASNNTTADTSDGSTSLLNVRKIQSKTKKTNKKGSVKKENDLVDMELTGNSATMLKVTGERRISPQEESKAQTIENTKRSARQKLFTSNSSDSDVTQSGVNASNKSIIGDRSSEEMPQLKLSVSSSEKNKNIDTSTDPDSKRDSFLARKRKQNSHNTDDNSTKSSLRLSNTTNEIEENGSTKSVEGAHKQKRKTNLPLAEAEASPPKQNKQEDAAKTNKNVTKRPTRRKLYNPDIPLNSSYFRGIEDSSGDGKCKTTFKKPEIPLTPVMLTTRAKRFLDGKKDQVECNDVKARTQVTPVKSTHTQMKGARTVKSTGKKAAATKTVVENDGDPKKRTSSFYFDKTPTKNTQVKMKKKCSIVCTRLHKPEVEIFQQIVKNLGGFYVEDEVTSNTTHLVAGESKRTINLLRALARGCWILKHEWLLKSLEAGKWLPEESYELTEFSRAVQRCRIERQAFGSNYSMDIFSNCGYIYIARSTIPRCSDLQELVRLCKGKLTKASSRAKIVVGEVVDGDEVTCVKETWILDSIAENKLKPLKNYLM